MAKRKLGDSDVEGDVQVKKRKKVAPKSSKKKEGLSSSNGHPPRASLLGLPGELRTEIYGLCLVKDGEIVINKSRNHVEPGLLRTYRKIRAEARSIFFGENDFAMNVYQCRVTR